MTKIKRQPDGSWGTLSNEALMDIFAFAPDDLAANRAGRLSSWQVERLREDLLGDVRAMWLILSIGAGTLALLYLVFALMPGQSTSIWGLIAGAALLLLPAVRLGWLRRRRFQADLQTASVTATCGALTLINEQTGSYYAGIGTTRFPITAEEHYALKHFRPDVVTAYYAPQSNTLLALEMGGLPDRKRKNQDNDDDHAER